MTCTPIALEGGVTGFVCGPRPKSAKCVKCGRASTRLCDAPRAGAPKKTCDAALCDTCRVVYSLPGQKEPLDLCPACAKEERWAPRPPLEERKLIAVTLRRPWAALVALGLCPVISLSSSSTHLWGDYVAIHAGLGEDAYAGERLARAGLNPQLPEALSHAAGTVMAVARAVRLEEVSPSLAPALSPLARGPVLLWVETPVAIAPVPSWGQGDVWVPSEELRRQVGRAYKAAQGTEAVRAPRREALLGALRAENAALERASWWEEELNGGLPSVPMAAEDLARLRATRRAETPYEALVRNYEESQARTAAIARKYNGYERSAVAMDAAGIKGYRCPYCQEWFCWHPGCHPHECPTEARP